MSSVVVSGDTSGAITLAAPAIAGANTLTLPTITDTLVGLAAAQTLTNKTLTSPVITGASVSAMASSVITSGTVIATTSGTEIDFNSVPSWVRRITVMLSGVGTSTTTVPRVQLGTASSFEITGYTGSFISNSSIVNLSTGFPFRDAWASTNRSYGTFTIVLLDATSNTWNCTANLGLSDTTNLTSVAGSKALAGTLTRLRLYVDGTATFTAGSANILWE